MFINLTPSNVFINNQGVIFTQIKTVTVGATKHHGNLRGTVESITLANGEPGGYYCRWESDVLDQNDRNGLYSEGQCGPDGQ
jgi:hypothetical protein